MRLRTASRFATLAVFLGVLNGGCSQGTDIQIARPSGEVKPSAPIAPSELKGDAKKSVGASSSSNIGKLGKNPMELAK